MEIIFETNVKKFIHSCERSTHAKIDRYVDMLESYAEKLTMPYAKRISHNLYELRIRGRQEARIFYCFHQGKIFVMHGFIKKSEKTPQREIDTATQRIKLLTTP